MGEGALWCLRHLLDSWVKRVSEMPLSKYLSLVVFKTGLMLESPEKF